MNSFFKRHVKIFLIIMIVLITSISTISCTKKYTINTKLYLSNKNSNDITQELYDYIVSSYGTYIISGQQESTWIDGADYEMNYIYDKTGKYPAIRGLDFMNDDFDGVVERSIDWWNKGGIVTICWHCGKNFSGDYNDCKEDVVENWEELFKEGTKDNTEFINNMDNAAKALLKLQESGVPVLWRPFHEFDGAWFWWGKGGSENFKKLWIYMYDRFTNVHHLNNLIWVLGYCHNAEDYGAKLLDWYPGDEYVDIAGADTYEVSKNGAEARLYKAVGKVVKDRKPMAMHECGLIPNVEQLKKVGWVFFMTWHSTWLTETNNENHLKLIYNNKYVITLDELPFKNKK